jgi:catechol 2,3-dioxygenase-like lactoylglutathione lyase family enzyme
MSEQSILGRAKAMSFVCTTSRENTKKFYGETLGLKLISEDPFAVAYETDGRMLRISSLKDFKAQPFTVLGWSIPDIVAGVKALKARGVTFKIYEGMGQDELGIWKSPDGTALVAWFSDPDGNILSLTQF